MMIHHALMTQIKKTQGFWKCETVLLSIYSSHQRVQEEDISSKFRGKDGTESNDTP